MREQKQVELVIGWSPSLERLANEINFEHYLDLKISELCGGLTRIKSTGAWVDDAGRSRKERYTVEDLQIEGTYHIKLTCELDKFDDVYKELQNIVKRAKAEFDMPVSWVHCCVTDIVGMHFEV